jgi:hypothetical protein
MPLDSAQGATSDNYELRQRAENRMGGLRSNRYSWWVHAQELANFFLPRRYKWIITPNQAARGSPINQHIIDSTGTLAARTLASGLLAGLSNPSTPWFKFAIDGYDDAGSAVVRWLAECMRRMYTVFQESNFYNAMATMYFDLVIFGTAVVIIYQDYENVIHCYNPCFGEYFVDSLSVLETVVLYREFVLTIAQIEDQFGYDNMSPGLQKQFDNGGAALTREYVVMCAIEPNLEPRGGIPEIFKFREIYWEAGSSRDRILRKCGYHDFPAVVPRWDLVANDPYGRSPAMDALGDVKQLQQETKRKAQAIDKMVNPPMTADVQLKNQPASLLPGGVTYVNGLTRERPGFTTVYTVVPPIAEMKQDIQEIQERIKRTFYNNLFTDISDLQTVRTAEEIIARKEEKLLMLPTIKRIDKEALAQAIERTWGIMQRGGLLPPPPPEAAGKFVAIKYTSPFAMAMKAAETGAIERSVQFAGNLVAVDPTVMDNFDLDATIHVYSDMIGADPRTLRQEANRDAIRADRAKDRQTAQVQQETAAAVQGANVLSQTDVGGGQNALERMLGGGGGGGGGGPGG